MQARIETLIEKKIIGKRLKMTLAENKTTELWRSFMPRRKEVINILNNNLISMQVYSEAVRLGDMNQVFEKWAGLEVADFDSVPDGMETFTLASGLYAVFHYKGLSTDTNVFRYIYGTWLSQSNYLLDDRPHFELLGDKYKNNDPESEEEIWIPIKPKDA